MEKKLTAPWIDPVEYDVEDVLDSNSIHLVCVVSEEDDSLHLVDAETFASVMCGENNEYNSNFMSISIERSMIEYVLDNKVYTKDIPRTKIAIDSIFINVDNIPQLRQELTRDWFEFI